MIVFQQGGEAPRDAEKHHFRQRSKVYESFLACTLEEIGHGAQNGIAFRPQTDGQAERVNLVLQEYLRNYVNADQTDWADHISTAEFSYNNTKHSRTGFSPFMVVSEIETLSPIDLAL